MRRRHRVLTGLVVCLCVGAPVAGAVPIVGAAPAPPGSSQAPQVGSAGPGTAGATPIVTYANDERRGNITVTVTLDDARGAQRALVDLSDLELNYTVETVDGFDSTQSGVYQWDGRTAQPTLTYTITLVEPTVFAPSIEGPYAVDPGPWAAVTPGSTAPEFGGDVSQPQFETEGPGYVTTSWVYLGAVERYDRTVDGETLVLVVPEAGAPVSEPETILTQLAETNRNRSLGVQRDRVVLLALPSDGIQTPWGGIAFRSVIVRDQFATTVSPSVWVHEYIHTRQNFVGKTTSRTEWLTEASANYYASYETLHQRRMTYAEFESAITADAYRSSQLSDPQTWASEVVPYVKGQRVLAYVDARIRATTEGEDEYDADR